MQKSISVKTLKHVREPVNQIVYLSSLSNNLQKTSFTL